MLNASRQSDFRRKPKITGLVANLTAAALLVHVLLGCCWHHAHEALEASSLTCAGGGDSSDGHGAIGYGPGCHYESNHHSQRHGSGCLDGSCAAASFQQLRQAISSARFAFGTPVPVSAAAGTAPAENLARRTAVDSGERHLSVRIHLLHQILLI